MEKDGLSLHRKAVVVDTHVDTILNLVGGRVATLGERSNVGHVDLLRLREGGVDIQFFAAYIEPEYKPERSLKRALQMIAALYRDIEKFPEKIGVALSYSDMERITGEGRIAAVISIEGGEAVAADIGVLECLYRLGVRSLGLTWNERNEIADGVGEKSAGSGLTDFGRQLIGEMNRLGMLIDVSHLAERGFWDVLECSRQPIIASHSNARAVCQHARNLNDAQIKALAANGGVMGMNFYPGFVCEREPSLDRIVDHIEYIIELVGPDHIGIGSDFDGIPAAPPGLEDVAKLPNLTIKMLERGFNEMTIRKILGENYLRVFRDVLK